MVCLAPFQRLSDSFAEIAILIISPRMAALQQ